MYVRLNFSIKEGSVHANHVTFTVGEGAIAVDSIVVQWPLI
jgi:hypothetical protein